VFGGEGGGGEGFIIDPEGETKSSFGSREIFQKFLHIANDSQIQLSIVVEDSSVIISK
jgi:hypothetical protein